MALDYLQELKKFSDGGGTDINAFLKQHTQATQTTPGPSVAPPVSDITPPPTAPNPNSVPPAPVSSGQNVVRATMAPPPPAATGAVASLPARNPIASRNLEPPIADQARILGEARPTTPITVEAAKPQQSRPVTPPTFPTLGTAPAQPAATPSRVPTLLQTPSERTSGKPFMRPGEIDEHDFRLPSEKKSGRDFMSGQRISAAENDSPPGAAPYSSGPLANPKPSPKPSNMAGASLLPRNRNQRAVVRATVPRIFSGAA